jgi:putative oxidoreductase
MQNNKELFPVAIAEGAFPLIARLLICGIFVQGALGKMMGWQGQAQYMASRGMQQATIPALLGIALVIEAVGVLCLLVGWQARVAAFIMFLYLGAVTVMLHNFWTLQGMQAAGMQTQFMKNVAIMGGLLMIAAFGAGRWSVDGKSSD